MDQCTTSFSIHCQWYSCRVGFISFVLVYWFTLLDRILLLICIQLIQIMNPIIVLRWMIIVLPDYHIGKKKKKILRFMSNEERGEKNKFSSRSSLPLSLSCARAHTRLFFATFICCKRGWLTTIKQKTLTTKKKAICISIAMWSTMYAVPWMIIVAYIHMQLLFT